jgi:hypothetical protein
VAALTRTWWPFDELEDWGSGVLRADADVVQPAVETQGELAEGVDLVVEDSVVGLGAAVGARAGFRAGVVDGGWVARCGRDRSGRCWL